MGPLEGSLSGRFETDANLGFGFDNTGFNEWANTSFNPEDSSKVLNGFYVSDHHLDEETGVVLAPDLGSATINGINTSTDFESARKLIGYIPENVNLYPYLTGLENLDYFCKINGENLDNINLQSILIKSGLQESVHNEKIETYSKGGCVKK